MTNTLSSLGVLLKQAIGNMAASSQKRQAPEKEATLYVPNIANTLLFAYEQLRNTSENVEDHLLLQKAILRFYRRNLLFNSKHKPTKLGKELVIELTQSEYLKNDTITLDQIDKVDDLVRDCFDTYRRIIKYTGISSRVAEKWILELLSVKTEQVFNDPIYILSFAHLAYAHFADHTNYDKIVIADEAISAEDRPTLLYIGVHKALLKSDDANIRSDLFDLYSLSFTDSQRFVEFNQKYDQLTNSKSSQKMTRFISKNGAPLRIVRSIFFNDREQYKPSDLNDETKIMNIVESKIDENYNQTRKSVNRGIFKSIFFLLLTKAIIGVLIEVPYDLLTTGVIVIVPLLINLLFPPLFIAITALTFRMPGPKNKQLTANYIQQMLYDGDHKKQFVFKYEKPTKMFSAFNIVYSLFFIFILYLIIRLLIGVDFNVVQIAIFMIFVSTASFLSYRLTLQIKELEVISSGQGFINLLQDFINIPFVFIGKQISYRFSQLNIVARILDVAIDLPLKSLIKLIRQWVAFINSKKDELL